MTGKLAALLIAILMMTGAVHAQFKGLGEKLLDKAKDEVENALSQDADDAAATDDPENPDDPEQADHSAKAGDSAPAQIGSIDIPANEIGWISEGEPFAPPRVVRAIFHNPAVVSATSLTGLEIKVERSKDGDYYRLNFMRPPDAGRLLGEISFAVDGETVLTQTLSIKMSRVRDATSLVEAMKMGGRLSVALPGAEEGTTVRLSLPLAGLAETLSPPAANVDQAAVMRAGSIGNQCAQREGGVNYFCACLSHEYVFAYDAATGPSQAFEAAGATCRAIIDANPLFDELTVSEAMLGARLDAVDTPVAGGARIGALARGGPAYAVGLRTGDIITKNGSAPGERLLKAGPPHPGSRAVRVLTVYSPSTHETRIVRTPLEFPPADLELKTFAPFEAVLKPEPVEAAQITADPAPSEPAPSAPEESAAPAPQKVVYADPIGEACARRHRISGLYDCACIAEKAGPLREELADRQLAEQKKYISKQTATVSFLREKLAAATTEPRKTKIRLNLERAEKRLAELKTRPDPADISVALVGSYAYKGAECKIGDYARRQEKKSCLAAASGMSGVSDPEAFCACSANKAAETWLQSEQAYKSSVATQTAAQARQACR